MRFEYMTLTASSNYRRGQYDGYDPVSLASLNEYGKAGWEVIAVEDISSDSVKVAFLKRELQ